MAVMETKIVVNAYGQSAGGVAPHFRLLVDGVDAGQATVSATNPTAYTFTAPVEAAQAHRIQVYYDNDGVVSGQDRNLYVKSVVVNGNTLSPTQASYDRDALDGQDVVAGQEGMWWQGALSFATPAAYYPAPTTPTTPTTPPSPPATAGASTIVVNAQGTAAGGVNAHFNVLVDGKKIGEGTAGTAAKDFAFTANVTPDAAHKVQIQYDNDAVVNNVDRNLLVNTITINGKTVLPNAANVTYDRYALDGKDVISGQSAMNWNGALIVSADKSYFPASTTTTPPAPTTPPAGTGTAQNTIKLAVGGSAAGGVGAHFNVLVDGQKIGEGSASTWESTEQTFKVDLVQDVAHKVQVQFDNDAQVNGADRNLYVRGISIDGKTIAPTDPSVTVDRGALDGQDTLPGTGELYWDATLTANVDKSFFHATTGGTVTPPPTTPPTTPPTAPTPSLSVTDVTVTEPGMSTGGTGIAPGFLHTEGGQIVDSAGHNVKLTGVNWFGAEGYAFAPQGLWMDSYQHHMDKMKELGFNVIRLPYSDAMLDAGRKPTGIDYSKNPDLVGKTSLEVFDKIIDYAGKIGMKIILDHHRSDDGASANENGLWYTAAHPESTMIANWKMLAQRYAGNDAVIGADLHNEPHNPTTWGDGGPNDWARAAERIGNAIQTVNKDWLLIVEGNEVYNNQWYWWGGNLLGQKAYDVHFNTANKLVYSVHDYGPSLHMMDWFKDANFPNNMPAKWTEMWGRLIQNDQHPVLVGEFGSRMETAIDQKWMPKLVQYMNGDWDGNGTIDLPAGDQGASWTYWAYSPGSGDTGGIMNDSWQVDYTKYNAIKAGLFKGSTAAPGQTDATFTVKLSAASGSTVKVNYATVDGTAKAGSDYTAAQGTLTFNPGETTKTVAVKVLSDSVTEGSETFSLKLSAPSAATLADDTGVGTITQATASAAAQGDAVYANLLAQQQPSATAAAADLLAQTATAPAADLFHADALYDYHQHHDVALLG